MNGARAVYAVHLDFIGDSAANRAKARALTRRWLIGRVGPWPTDADPTRCAWAPTSDQVVRCRSLAAGDESFWETTWLHPHATDQTLRWRTSVVVGGHTASAWTQLRLSIEAASGCDQMTGWVTYDVSRPHLVHTLVGHLSALDATRQLSAAPMRIRSTADVDHLVELIAHPGRRLPVLVTTRHDNQPPGAHLAALADGCIGLAHIVDITDTPSTFELAERLGPRFAVHSGAARLYFPGWSPLDQPRQHPLWAHAEIDAGDRHGTFAHYMSRRLYAAAAFRTPVPTLIERVTTHAAHARITTLRAQADAANTINDLLTSWDQDLDRLERAIARAAALEGKVRELAAENRTLKTNAIALATTHAPPQTHQHHDEKPPATVLDAVTRAADRLEHLVFHSRAFDSAAGCSYRWPQRIYDDLAILDKITARWQATGRLSGGWTRAAYDAGLLWGSDISVTAKTAYPGDYEITLAEGTKTMLGPHLKRGARTGPAGHYRAYLFIDDTTRTVVVGYIGAHLRDASNR